MTDSPSELAEVFRKLGADDPAAWAQSQIEEGIPQLARFLFLRQAWRLVVGDGDTGWIDRRIASSDEQPNAPFSGVGQALHRLRQQGASAVDISDVVRGMQVELLHGLCYLLDDPGDVEPVASEIAWSLVQVSEDDEVLDVISGLHESVLETDPTGREMRPRGDAG